LALWTDEDLELRYGTVPRPEPRAFKRQAIEESVSREEEIKVPRKNEFNESVNVVVEI
jgi:hypothetical protein